MSPSSQHKPLIPLIIALLIFVLYYAFGLVRAGGYIFGLGMPTFVVTGLKETRFMFFFVSCGTYLVALLTFYFLWRGIGETARAGAVKIITGKHFVFATVAVSFCAMVFVRFALLGTDALTDDENVYLFVAKTLLNGRLKNPSPEFYWLFKYHLTILDQDQWMGQYTIGHPLILAFGLLTYSVDVIVPLVSAMTLYLIYLIAKDHFGCKIATIAVFLTAVSPQFILTGATLLGYPTAAFSSALMIFSSWRFHRDRRWYFAVFFLTGSVLLLLNRPQSWVCLGLPLGVFFLVSNFTDKSRSSVVSLAIKAGVTLISVGIFLYINYLQTGDPLKTSQFAFLEAWGRGTGIGFNIQSPAGIHTVEKGLANLALSLTRQNLWLFGWPLSFFFLLFIPLSRFVVFLLSWTFAYWAFYTSFYSPGINLTGPVYYYEMIVPAVILSACGIVRLDDFCRERFGDGRGKGIVPALALSLCICSFLMFLPPITSSLRSVASVSSAIYRALDAKGAHHAVIFADCAVPDEGYAWVNFPKISGPDFASEDRIFARWPETQETMEKFLRKFPNRQVWGVKQDDKGLPLVWRLK